MTKVCTQEVIDWAIEKIQKFDNEKKLYNLSAIILSILDVVCGITAIFYASMLVTSVVASILCGTIWGGRFIQIVKTERLAKSLKVMTTASLTYIAVRKKRSEYMQNIFKNIKNNPLTIIFAPLGGAIMAFVTYTLAQLYFINLPQYLYIIFAVIAAIITIVVVVVLGWDKTKAAILRNAKKNLSAEDYDKVVEMVGTLEKAAADAKATKAQAEADEAQKLKNVEQAKQTIAAYEARQADEQALKAAYEQAKQFVAENEKPTDVANETTQA
ncbi:MAG: hypothetical protein IJ301_02170 [Clostridia bacterium]|nr:hypothetical protein [Clostridia bacterium]